MDKLRGIKFFCHAVEMKSFSAVARTLGVPTSVISKSIAGLEAELRFTLFNRSTRRLAVTEAGAEYYTRCRQALLDIEEAETVGRNGMSRPAGTLRVGVHPVFQIALCRAIGAFVEAHREVVVDISHTNSPSALLDDGLDLVLRVGAIEDSALIVRAVGELKLITCASPCYLALNGRPAEPRDLARHRAIIPGRGDEETFRRWVFARGPKREVVTVSAGIVLREGVGLGLAAAGGGGIVRMYDFAARPFIQDGLLEEVLGGWTAEESQPVYVVIPNRRNVPAKVRAFIEFIRTVMQ